MKPPCLFLKKDFVIVELKTTQETDLSLLVQLYSLRATFWAGFIDSHTVFVKGIINVPIKNVVCFKILSFISKKL